MKKILAQCMGVLVDLKEQISNLVLFFTAISCMVEHVIKNHVTNFVEEAKNAKEYMMELGGTSLADFQRQVSLLHRQSTCSRTQLMGFWCERPYTAPVLWFGLTSH